MVRSSCRRRRSKVVASTRLLGHSGETRPSDRVYPSRGDFDLFVVVAAGMDWPHTLIVRRPISDGGRWVGLVEVGRRWRMSTDFGVPEVC